MKQVAEFFLFDKQNQFQTIQINTLWMIHISVEAIAICFVIFFYSVVIHLLFFFFPYEVPPKKSRLLNLFRPMYTLSNRFFFSVLSSPKLSGSKQTEDEKGGEKIAEKKNLYTIQVHCTRKTAFYILRLNGAYVDST